MPRYIDEDKLIRDLINKDFYPAIVKRAIMNAPTEDVVPRSELEKAKQEVAEQIVAEISKRFEVLLKDYPCEGDLISAKKFLGVHWKYIANSIMADYKRNT